MCVEKAKDLGPFRLQVRAMKEMISLNMGMKIPWEFMLWYVEMQYRVTFHAIYTHCVKN